MNVNLHFYRQQKQTARIYGVQTKNGFGDYKAGFVGNLTENNRNYLRICFSIMVATPMGGDTSLRKIRVNLRHLRSITFKLLNPEPRTPAPSTD